MKQLSSPKKHYDKLKKAIDINVAKVDQLASSELKRKAATKDWNTDVPDKVERLKDQNIHLKRKQ